MLLTLLLGAANLVLALIERNLVRVSSFDISPIGVVIAAQRGENVIFAALVLSLPHAMLNPNKLRYLWATLPLTIIIGYLALAVESAVLLVVLFHAALALVALLLGQLSSGYLVFALVNFVTNLVIARFYLFVA